LDHHLELFFIVLFGVVSLPQFLFLPVFLVGFLQDLDLIFWWLFDFCLMMQCASPPILFGSGGKQEKH
jgi:hypothetical protein